MKIIKTIYNDLFLWGSDIHENFINQNNENNVKLNPFTLAFPKILEKTYLEHYYNKSTLQIKFSTFAGALLFIIFFPFDLFLVPELFTEFLILRVGLAPLIIFSAVFILSKSKNKKISQPILSSATILVALINISFIIRANPKLNSYYYVGIILIYFWIYTFLKLRFIWATFTGFTIFIIYEYTTLFLINIEPELYYISTSYLFASNLAGMSIAYALEYYSRRDYYQNLLLKKSSEKNVNLSAKLSENDMVISQAEKQLRLQSKALESAANSIVILDRTGKIIWCNPSFLKLTGYELNEVLGQNPRILKSGKHDKTFYKNIWTTVLSGNVWAGEIINKNKNGELYYEEMVITPVTNNESEGTTHFISIKQDVSARKKMEEELFESEKRLRNLIENSTMGIYRSTLNGDILMANNALVRMFGFESIEDFRCRDTSQTGYVNPTQRDNFVNKLNEEGTLIGFESEWKKKDGTIIFIRESARSDVDEFGNVVFEGTVEDITLSKIAEKELKESQENLQVVVDNVYDAIFIHDLNGKVVNVNNKVLDLYNISLEEALNLSIQDISSSENSFEMINAYWQNVVNGDKTYKFEWKAMRPADKYIFDVEVFLSKITLGKDEYILETVRDISDQKDSQKKLLITQKAVDLNATPIFWLTEKAEFIYVNKAATEKLGYSFDELLKMKVSDINASWTDQFWKDFGYSMIREKGLLQYETALIKKDTAEFPVEVSTSIINFENEEVIIAIVNDISERKKDAEILIKAKEKAEQSDKLKSEFLAGMSHEIRTPVNTILNFVSLIKEDLGANISEDTKSSFEMIDSGSRRLIRTIDSIINMSQLQSGAYEITDETFSIIDDILKPLMQEFRRTAEQKNLDFDLVKQTNNTLINADKYTVTQLFVNLIDNALKYTKAGNVKLFVTSDENYIITKVVDTGIGISKSFLPTLFDPFIQEEMGYTRSFEGNGLGLALVKKYLDLNNGIIDVDSKKGVGTTFTVKLKKTSSN